jgi:hypothetical protein
MVWSSHLERTIGCIDDDDGLVFESNHISQMRADFSRDLAATNFRCAMTVAVVNARITSRQNERPYMGLPSAIV